MVAKSFVVAWIIAALITSTGMDYAYRDSPLGNGPIATDRPPSIINVLFCATGWPVIVGVYAIRKLVEQP